MNKKLIYYITLGSGFFIMGASFGFKYPIIMALFGLILVIISSSLFNK